MAYKNIEDSRAYGKRWYYANREKRINQIKKNKLERVKKWKIIFVNKLGGKCIKCGYNKCYRALDFHHPNDDKNGNISAMISQGYSFNNILKEVMKCELLCANCHREIDDK